jgi:DNA-binding beta-propeller fold protein YncE
MRSFKYFGAGVVMVALVSCTPGPRQTTAQFSDPPSLDLVHRRIPGRQPDGSILLHNQWSLRPAGRQVALADFPVNIAVHPDSRYAAVLHCGFSAHQILIVDLSQGKVVSRRPVHEAFYGLAFSSDGKKLFCSGAGDEVIHEYSFDDGKLLKPVNIKLRNPKERAVPAGLAVDKATRHLYVANVWGHRLTRVDLLPTPKTLDIPLGKNLPALSAAPVKPSKNFAIAAANKRAQAARFTENPGDTFPYGCLLDEKRGRLYVSLWAHSAIAVLDLKTGRVIATWPAQEHPCEMALTHSGKYLFVANANRNTVSVFDTDAGKPLETIWAALYPHSPPGSTPNSLALSPDDKTLFVANADNDIVAVFDVSKPGKARSLGFIPTGWYPTSVRVTPDGKRLLIANGRGITPLADPFGPEPGLTSTNFNRQYIGSLYHGTLSIIDLLPRADFLKRLAVYSVQAIRCSPLNADATVTATRPPNNPIPLKPGDPSPIKYCLYIIKENRTYDQVLGDMPEGNGDPNLCLFPWRVTPNHHKLARQFVLLDNFYVNSEVSADGHEWSMGAYATDFVKKMWPLAYGHDSSGKFPYPSEGNFAIAAPAEGYIWDRAKQAGVSYCSYGEFVANGRTPNDPGSSRVKALQGHFDKFYRSFDLNYPDVKRAQRFISDLKGYEAKGDMPRLQILRLPNDHTYGATPKRLTPTALVADNDQGLGMVVQALSHSKFWPQTAIFVLEDDSQDGPDHVDAHRSVAFVISPYARHGAVDSTMYSTTSVLRTIELILGLQPMTQYDAAATPMFSAFQPVPDLTPYEALPANVNLHQRNPLTAWGAAIKMNFAREDAADDTLLNEMIWHSVRGPNSPMPAPVHAAFVYTHPQDDDE